MFEKIPARAMSDHVAQQLLKQIEVGSFSATGKLPIKMLHDRILVALRKEDGDRRSSGGILIPATAQVAKRLVWGEAKGVGPSVRQVKVGDQVLFSPEDQHEVEVHGEDLIILRERDVHAVAAERIEEAGGIAPILSGQARAA